MNLKEEEVEKGIKMGRYKAGSKNKKWWSEKNKILVVLY